VNASPVPSRYDPDQSVIPQRDNDTLCLTMKKLSEMALKNKPLQSTSNLRITTVAQFKSYSIRMIKALKEDLAKIQSEYIARVNGNIDEYLASKEDTKLMTEE